MKLRKNNIEKLDHRVYDVLIIGGGINGAVSASALTSQGASVALIDRGDFAGFTSQHSSNLVWGGIKYMESFEFPLVRKLCVSRNHLIKSYPSMVKEIRFFTTLARGFRRSRFTIFLGTLVYWLMGNFFTRPPRLLSRKDIAAEEPTINIDNAAGGLEYSDAYLIDNDARFVFKFIREALNHGGICANYVESLGSDRSADGYWITRARDLVSGRELTIKSRILINAGGPFVDEHNSLSKQKTDHRHLFSKGVHLLVNRLTNHRRVMAFFADDGRLFFVIPMGTKSCIGTTDDRVDQLPPRVTPEDRRFILENINKRFKLEKPLTEADIIAERCGVRPLVVDPVSSKKDTGDWTALSRKHAVEINKAESHISIFGGKLTDCLNVGDEIVAAVRSMKVPLPHHGFRWYGEPPEQIKQEYFHQAELMKLDDLTEAGASEPISTRLWRRYGHRAIGLLEDIREDPSMAEVLIEGTEYLRCEIHTAARSEMVTKLEDFLRRRSKIALIERTETIRNAPGLMEACHILFGDEAQARFDEYFASVNSDSGAAS